MVLLEAAPSSGRRWREEPALVSRGDVCLLSQHLLLPLLPLLLLPALVPFLPPLLPPPPLVPPSAALKSRTLLASSTHASPTHGRAYSFLFCFLPPTATQVEAELRRIPPHLAAGVEQHLWSILYMPQVGGDSGWVVRVGAAGCVAVVVMYGRRWWWVLAGADGRVAQKERLLEQAPPSDVAGCRRCC